MGIFGLGRRMDRRRARVLRLGAAAVLILLIAALLVPVLDRGESQLSAYSGHWNDVSMMRELAGELGLASRSLVSGPKALSDADPQTCVLAIIGVEKGYTEEERRAIESFARAGGNIILADDFGRGGELLEGLTQKRIGLRTECLRDLRFQKNPDFVKVRVRQLNSLGFAPVDLLLNRPAALSIPIYYTMQTRPGFPSGVNPEVVANTSAHSWLDGNRNLERDPDELESPYPVAAVYRFESGARMLAVSDPGIFVNDMIGRSFNREFIQSALLNLGDHRSTLIFDESRHSAEGVGGGAGAVAIQAATGLSSNPAAIFLAFLLAFLLSMYQYSRLPDPAVRRHRDVLGDPRLLHFRSPAITANEFQRLRVAIVEKVRLAYGLSPEEFYPAMLPRLGAMMGDAELTRFLHYETWPDVHSFLRALSRAASWAPPAAPVSIPREPAAPGAVEWTPVEVVDGPESGQLDVNSLLGGESGGVRIWDPSNRRASGDGDVDSILYGRPRDASGSGHPAGTGGGGG